MFLECQSLLWQSHKIHSKAQRLLSPQYDQLTFPVFWISPNKREKASISALHQSKEKNLDNINNSLLDFDN